MVWYFRLYFPVCLRLTALWVWEGPSVSLSALLPLAVCHPSLPYLLPRTG